MISKIRAIAVGMDTLKITRRTTLVLYATLLYMVASWYMGLIDPTAEQTAFASVIATMAPLIFSFYTKSPVKYQSLAAARQIHKRQEREFSNFDNRNHPRRPNNHHHDYNKPPDDFWDEQQSD